jgi:hypothetical protein
VPGGTHPRELRRALRRLPDLSRPPAAEHRRRGAWPGLQPAVAAADDPASGGYRRHPVRPILGPAREGLVKRKQTHHLNGERMARELTAAGRLMTIIHGSWQTHVTAAFAELGLADLLGGQPSQVAGLARKAGADPAVFPRFVRACCRIGLLAEDPPGCVRLTPEGELLRGGTAASLRDFARVQATPGQLRPYELLAQAIRDGGPAAAAALGEPVWEYYGKRPDEAALLESAINGIAALEAPAVVAAVDLTGCETIVELRGGVSAILAALLDAAPHARGVLVDRPELVAAARERIGRHLLGRVETRAGEALDLPQGLAADLYLISHGLHFLGGGAAARQALAKLRDASPRRARLVIIDPVLTADSPAVCDLLDLHTLVLLGGRERTADEFGSLLAAAGWRLEQIVPTGVLADVIVASQA